MKIKLDDLESVAVRELLEEHHRDMLQHSPVESVHVLDLSSLKALDVLFWTAWIDGELAGCGALKKLTEQHVEIKSMRTANRFLRTGVAAKLLTHMLVSAKAQAYAKVSLETGTTDAFTPAKNMYMKFGFKACQPFSDYQEDPYSLYLSMNIE